MENYYDLAAILMQELFENGLLDIDALQDKYEMTNEFKQCLVDLYNEYFYEE